MTYGNHPITAGLGPLCSSSINISCNIRGICHFPDSSTGFHFPGWFHIRWWFASPTGRVPELHWFHEKRKSIWCVDLASKKQSFISFLFVSSSFSAPQWQSQLLFVLPHFPLTSFFHYTRCPWLFCWTFQRNVRFLSPLNKYSNVAIILNS